MLILPKCGTSGCHKDSFDPKFTDASKIAPATVGVNAKLSCKSDKYINKTDPAKSFLLLKVTAKSGSALCPSGGDGMLRMPYLTDPLSQADQDCIAWYVNEVAKN